MSSSVEPHAPEHRPVAMDVVSGPHRGKHFEFETLDTFVAGRAHDSHLSLADDPHFSRYHFRLEIRPPQCYLVDLESRNGTFVNGERVAECYLNHGDVISVGGTRLRVAMDQADSQSASLIATEIPKDGVAAAQHPETGTPATENTLSVPGYTIVEQLGQGMMGTVHRAIQKSTGHHVAIKVIIPNRVGSEKETQLFLREASILSQLAHPRVVKFYEFGVVAGQFFIVMDYVQTVDFSAILASQSPESRVRIPCGVICQVLEALEYVHSLSIIHRDIKPANLLLSRPRAKLKCQLADFGLAKNYANAGFSEMTNDNEARGTVAFMPPEQILDCRYAKPAADLYAAGATLYYFLSGTHAFDFSSSRNAVVQVLHDDMVPLGDRCPGIPAELTKIVHRAMAKDPSSRFGSAQEMRKALLPFSRRRK